MFELNQEIVLLSDILQSKQLSTSRAVHLIKDICEGLKTPIDEDERKFLKLKLSFYLILNVLHHESGKELLVLDSLPHCVPLTWNSFFEICVKSTICDSLFTILTLLPKNISLLFLKKFFQELFSCKYFNDCVAVLCVFFSVLLQRPEIHTVAEFDNQLDNYLVSNETFNLLPISEYHVSTMEQSILLLENFKLFQGKNSEKLDILQLHKLKKCTAFDFKNKSSSSFVSGLTEAIFSPNIDTDTTFPILNESKSLDTLKSLHKKLFIMLSKISNQFSLNAMSTKLEQKYWNLLVSYIEKVQEIEMSNSTFHDLKNQEDIVWNAKSALYCAANLLQNYDGAVAFLLQYLSKNLSIKNVQMISNELLIAPECIATSGHVLSLCEIISTLTKKFKFTEYKDCFNCALNLLFSGFKILPFKSKLSLLQKRCSNGFLCFRNVKLYCNSKDVHQKVNLIFNTLTKTNVSSEFENFLQNVCEVAFIVPQMIIQCIVNQIAYHKEHHELFIKLFQTLPCLALTEDDKKHNELVACFFQIIETNGTKDTMNSICEFVTLLLQINIDNFAASSYFSEQLIVYVLSILTVQIINNSAEQITSLNFVLQIINCISNTFNKLDLFNLVALIHSLACIVDATNIIFPDHIYGQAKMHLIYVVDVLSCRVLANEPGTNIICDWLKNASICLQWTTKLYLQPVLQNVNIILPVSLKTICIIPEDVPVSFDAEYEQGTGLTAWLQCLVIHPGLFSVSSLNIQDLCHEDKQWFKHGMVVGLSQVLPFFLEDDWHIVLEAMKALINQHFMSVKYPIDKIKISPLLNLKQFSTPLRLTELLHCVNIILSSKCCEAWMNSSLWTRYTRCYAISIKQLVCDPADVSEIQEQLFFVSQLFMYSCDFLILLEGIKNTGNSCDSIHVLLLDLLTMFCDIHTLNCAANTIVPQFWLDDLTTLKCSMACLISSLKCNQTKTALSKKLVSVT